jgi:hypothetical protein
MVPDDDQRTPEFQALLAQTPGGAITCPYCAGAVEYAADGQSLVVSSATPLRYSRTKMETRARDYGLQTNPPDFTMTPERWAAQEKLMFGALHQYRYAEDATP